jgi:hypothetical protein
MDELLERVAILRDASFQEWKAGCETLPEKLLDILYAAYQQLHLAYLELVWLKYRKEE